MSDLIQLIQEADFALLNVEQTRVAIEAAKAAMELAKSDHDRAKAAFEEVLSRADEVGVSRPKLRKIVEERAAVLAASGLLSVPANKVAAAKPTKSGSPKKPAKSKAKTESEVPEFDEVEPMEVHLNS